MSKEKLKEKKKVKHWTKSDLRQKTNGNKNRIKNKVTKYTKKGRLVKILKLAKKASIKRKARRFNALIY